MTINKWTEFLKNPSRRFVLAGMVGRPKFRVLFFIFGFSPSSAVRALVFKPNFIENNIGVLFFQTESKLLDRLQKCLGSSLLSRVIGRILGTLIPGVITVRTLVGVCLVPFFDGVVLVKYCPPWVATVVKKMGKPILYDFDDPMWLPSPTKESEFKQILKTVEFVSTENRFEVDYASKFHPNVFLFRGPPQVEKFKLFRQEHPKSVTVTHPVIGWVGSPSTLHFLDPLLPVISQLSRERSDFFFKVVGTGCKDQEFKKRWSGVPLKTTPIYDSDSMISEVCSFDIGLFPLFRDPGCLFRGTLKARIYMSAQIPVVATPYGEILDIIEPGESGFFADSTEEWVEYINILLNSQTLREHVGIAGHQKIETNYSLNSCFSDLKKGFLDRIASSET